MVDSRQPWWRPPTARAAADGGDPVVPNPGRAGRERAGLAFWALMGFTFVLLLAPQERFPVLAPLRIAMLFALLAMAAHLFARLARGLPIITFTAPIKIALLLVGWTVLTVPFSMWPGGSLAFLLEMFSKTVIVFLLLASVIDSATKLNRMTWALVLMSVPLALTTVRNFLAGTVMATGDRVAGYSASLTANPNDLALMLNLILPLCIALLLAARRARTRVLLGLIAALLVVAIIATFSRAGFLTLIVIGLSYLWLYRKRAERLRIPALVLLVLLALPLVPAGYYERVSTIFNIEDDPTHSAEIRLRDMKAAVGLAVANPVTGAGIGMNIIALNEVRGETWTAVHNVYLQYLVELGVPGLVLFLLLYGSCLRATGTLLRTVPPDRSDGLFQLAEGLRVSLIAFGVSALFHPVAYHFYFYYIAGLAVAAAVICRAEQPARVQSAMPRGAQPLKSASWTGHEKGIG